MKKMRCSKGFTMVELLAVIVIIGILLAVSITAVVHFIDRARDEQKSNQEKTLAMAAESYFQANRSQLPKSIGETAVIPISVLKEYKYITEDIKNSHDESCMENSYVTAYKESKTKYVYKAYLYCGDEKPSTAEAKVTPTINIDFVDADGNSIKNDSSILDKVSEAKFIIEFTGGKKDGKKIEIDGYSYSILAKVGDEVGLREVYSSGTLSANHSTDITVNRDNNLKDYIDISDKTTVAIKATVRNVDGGINDKVEFIGSDETQAEVVYHDKKPPVCVTDQTKGEPEANDWINISSGNVERKITVVCKDGSGSGCIRSTFTKTWSGNTSVEYDNITIKDNAGNTANCKVRVNYDREYPIINLDAYAKGSGEESVGNSVLTGTKTTENSIDGTAIINSSEYNNLVSGYMNNDKYPNGVIYKVTLKDSVALKNWKWEVNNKNITSTTDANYERVSAVEEARTGSCVDKKECSINITFEANGLRKGVLTVYDKAGNKATYTIYANIDRNGPTKPTITNSSSGSSDGTWTKSNINLNLKSTDSQSGIGEYYYTYSSSATTIGTDRNTQWVKLNGGTNQTSFTTEPWTNEINKTVYIKVCDRAGNCSAKNSTDLKIDRTAPTGLAVTGYKKNSSADVTTASGLSTIATNTWYKGWEVVIPSGASDSGAGGVYYTVTVTGASENTTDSKQNYRNVNAEGTSTISFKACDKLDNCSSAVSYIARLDRTGSTKPSISNSSGGAWTKSNVTLTLGSTDSLSGIGEYYYSYNSSATAIGSNDSTQWVKLTGGTNKVSFTTTAWTTDINKTVYVKSCDIVGNCSGIASTNIKIDKTAPTTPTISNPSGGNWTLGPIMLTISSKDTGSGLKSYQYTSSASASTVGGDSSTQWYIESGGTTSAESFNSQFSAERNQVIYWRTCDAVDNCSNRAQTTIRIDKTKPTCSVTKTKTNSTSGVNVNVNCSDGGSGCSVVTSTYTGLKSNKTYTVYDNVGNSGTCSVSISHTTKCSETMVKTTQTATGCAQKSNYKRWQSCYGSPCRNQSICSKYNSNSNTAQGCCWVNDNCKVYYS